MKEWMNRIFILMMTVTFTVAILRVSNNSMMSAEEELIENIVKVAKTKGGCNGIDFFEIFGGEQRFMLEASKDCHFNNRNNRLDYQDPLIDIPLMPPELKA